MLYRLICFFPSTCTSLIAVFQRTQQQKLGKLCTGYINGIWAGARQAIAIRGLLAKFSQNTDLREQLLKTENGFARSSNFIEYTYCNYEVSDAKYDLEETAKELAAAQMALDLANTTVEFDVEI